MINVNFNEASTWRGAVWAICGILSLILVLIGSIEQALAVISIASSISGGIGIMLKDKLST